MPIIPAIPRKLERKTQQDASYTTLPKSEVGIEKQPGKGTRKHDTCVTGDQILSLANTNQENATNDISEPKDESSTVTQVLAEGNLI